MSKTLFLLKLTFLPLLFCQACMAQNPAPPQSFEECVAAGNKVLRSYPAKCVSAEGMTFVEKTETRPASTGFCKDLCGNGSCEEIVCMAEGCPCPESQEKCPEDCKS